MRDEQSLEFPEWFRLVGDQPLAGSSRGFVPEMFYRERLVRAERNRYEYFRPVLTSTDAWFEGWSGKERDPWVRLPTAPDAQDE